MAEDLGRSLQTGQPGEIARVIDALEVTLDRQEWATVANEAYIGATGEIRAASARYFVRAANLYTQFLSATFHMIPWDSAQLLPEEEFNSVFQEAVEATGSFQRVTPAGIRQLLTESPRSLAVLRMIAGLSRNQISYLLKEHYETSVSPDDLRTLERLGRVGSRAVLDRWDRTCEHLANLLFLAVRGELLGLREGVETDKFRPLTDKIDTRGGWESVARVSTEGVPYAALLYQRYVGSVFGQAINASTSLKGDLLEGPIQKLLQENGIPF